LLKSSRYQRGPTKACIAEPLYVLSRNGSTVVNDLTATTYRDDGIWPGTPYQYAIQAVGAGAELSKRSTVKIKTGTPPLVEARLSGDYDVPLTPVSYVNTTRPKAFDARFSFRPTCPPSEGACDVR